MPDINSVTPKEVITIDDQLWEQLIELTQGEAALCFQCGVCTAACPWGLVKKEPLSVRTLMRQAQLGIRGEDGGLWLCTTCAQCEAYCPRGVDIPAVFRALRTVAWRNNNPERGLPSLLWSIHWNNNPWTQPPSQRAQWASALDIPVFDPSQHELLLYIGCTPSYDRRGQQIATAVVHLLRAAGVQFGFLGDEEPCCGEAALSVGHKQYFEEIAAQTTHVLNEKGVTDLVTISPHCFDVFRNHYPADLVGTPRHYTQLIAQLTKNNRLHFAQTKDLKITFQDPCYLGRINQEYNAPRRILEQIPGLELVEMEYSAGDGLCCGGGGGRMWLETPAGERFSDLRIEQADQTGADVLATACPFCVTCLEDSLKMHKSSQLAVRDIAEIAAQALPA